MIRGLSLSARIAKLEEIPVGPAGWSAAFLSIVAVRHLLEIRTSQYPIYPASAFYVHYLLAYLAPLLALSLILSLFSGVRLERVLRLMLLAWGLTLLPPLIDTIAARPHETRIGYMDLRETPWTTVLLRFFDPRHPLVGTTPGIRVETAIASLLGGVYVLLRASTRRLARAFGTAAAVYVTALVFFTLPVLFVRALRLAVPGLPIKVLYSAVGRIARPADATVKADQAILIYLIPLTLVLAAAALARVRPPLLRAAARAAVRSEAWSWAILCGAGAAAGWVILDGVPRPASPAPFDLIARAAGPLALGLWGAALAILIPDERGEGPRGPGLIAVGWVVLAAASLLGASASTDLAALASIAAGAGVLARGLPRVFPLLPLVPQVASGIAVLAAYTAGYALAGGNEAIVLLPSALLVALASSGFLVDLTRSAPGAAGPIATFLRGAAAAAPLVGLAVPMVSIGAPPTIAGTLVAVLFSAAFLATSTILPPRPASALALAGLTIILQLSLSSPALSARWRALALASPTYYMRTSQNAEAAGDLDTAIGAAAEAVRRAPETAATHHRLGLVRVRRGDMAGAEEAFRRAAALDPRDAAIRGNLAAALLELGRAEEALEAFDFTIRLDPDLVGTRFNRARCLDRLGRTADATTAWRDYVERARNLPEEAASVEFARRRLKEGDPR